MTVRIVPFCWSNLNTFFPADFVPVNINDLIEYNLRHSEFRRLASVISGDGTTIGICGYHHVGPSNLEVFLWPCKNLKKYAREILWAMREMTDILSKQYDRVQMAVLEHNKKWAEKLGFEYESTAKKYLGNMDHFIYVKVGK